MSATNYPRSFPTPGPIDVSIRSGAGSITVNAVNITETEVDLRPSNPGDATAEKAIDASRVDYSDGALRIDIPRKASGLLSGRSPSVDIVVTVPQQSTVSIQSGSADVFLDGGLGDVSTETGSGDVSIANAADASVKTGSGDVRAEYITAVLARSGSGDVTVAGCAGRVDAEAASGDVQINHVQSGSRAKTASGDILIEVVEARVDTTTASGDIQVSRATTGGIAAKTATGGVAIAIAPGTAAKLDCSSVTGQFTSELDDIDRPEESDLTIEVAVRTVSGSININRATKV